jgi:predicted phosphodiesterase
MRIALVSDIHGNFTGVEAVLADIRQQAPDLVLHGGDLADSGSCPVEVIDLVRDLGWPGVMGNTDEMLVRPQTLEEFASQSTAPAALWVAVRKIASATRAALGEERLAWLRALPMVKAVPELRPGFALVHASPTNCWRAPAADASEEDLEEKYGSLGAPFVAYGHTHLPSIRNVSGTLRTVINTGSVGLSYDGDPRAAYLLMDDDTPTIRRVEYDVEKELRLLASCGLPGALWTAKMLRSGRPAMP